MQYLCRISIPFDLPVTPISAFNADRQWWRAAQRFPAAQGIRQTRTQDDRVNECAVAALGGVESLSPY